MTWRARVVDWLGGDVVAARTEQAVTVAVAQASAAFDVRIQEAMSATHAEDLQLAAQGFHRITAGGTHLLRRDLPPLAQDRQNQLAYHEWESIPLAKWLIETMVDFVLGEGATATSEVPEIQAVIDAFWHDQDNKLDIRADHFTREFGLYGELCLEVFVNQYNGHVTLGYIDPLQIDEVLRQPGNVLVNTGVLLKGTAGSRPAVLKIIREDARGYLMPARVPMGERVIGSKRNGDLVEAPAVGSCFLVQTNKVSNASRGRSDLIALLDWLDGYDQFLFDSMDAAGQLNQFVYDVKLEDMSETQIQEYAAKQKRAKRGETFYHNQKVTRTAVTPDLKAQDKDAYAKLLQGNITGANGLPMHWYGMGDGATFASAKEMGVPPIKRLSRRQKEIRFLLSGLVRFQLHQKIDKGLLKDKYLVGTKTDAEGNSTGTLKATDQCFTIGLPELSMRDQSAIVAALTGLASSLTEAQGQGWIRPETACKLFCATASQLGIEIKADEEYTPGAGPAGAGLTDYDPDKFQQFVERAKAQLDRLGKGDGENVLQPKAATNGAVA